MAGTARAKGSDAETIVTLKVTLRGIKPPVWRRLLMPAGMTLGALHHAIQAAMGWHDSHLHAFDIAGRQYGDRGTVDDVADEERMTLGGLLRSGVARFAYTYDFGDNWEHTVAIERNRPPPAARRYPACIAGRRNCPPEDCGGPWGYAEFLAILADPAHPEHAERLEWLEEDLDPDEFSVEVADAAVAARFNRIKTRPKRLG